MHNRPTCRVIHEARRLREWDAHLKCFLIMCAEKKNAMKNRQDGFVLISPFPVGHPAIGPGGCIAEFVTEVWGSAYADPDFIMTSDAVVAVRQTGERECARAG